MKQSKGRRFAFILITSRNPAVRIGVNLIICPSQKKDCTIHEFGLVEFVLWHSLRGIGLLDDEDTIVRLLMLQERVYTVEKTAQMFRTISITLISNKI
jgi:hypothetical protein